MKCQRNKQDKDTPALGGVYWEEEDLAPLNLKISSDII